MLNAVKTVCILLTLVFLCTSSQAYDMLIITHVNFTDADGWEQQLNQSLLERGISSNIYYVNDGMTVNDIKSIISTQKITTQDLNFILIVGAGYDTYDAFRDTLYANEVVNSFQNNFIPFNHHMAQSEWDGRIIDIPSDNQYCDGYDVKIGRIPAQSIAEIEKWIQKYEDYYYNLETYQQSRTEFNFFVQNNPNIDNGCVSYLANIEVDSTVNNYLSPGSIPFNLYKLSTIHPSTHCDISEDAEQAFADAVNDGIAFTIVSGTGGDSHNLAGFWGNPNVSDYSLFDDARGNFIFGNTCSLGLTSHPLPSKDNVLKNLLFDTNSGTIGFCGPATLTSQFSTMVVYDNLFSVLSNSDYQDMGTIVKTVADEFMQTNYLPYKIRGSNRLFYSQQRKYHVQGLILYGDPSMAPPIYRSFSQSEISLDQHLNGLWEVKQDVTIQSGVTLSVSAGSILFFTQNSSLVVEGTLVVNGTSKFPTLFAGASSAPGNSYWEGIKVQNGGDIVLNNAKIKDAHRGVSINDNSVANNITVENVEFNNCYTGVYVGEKDDVAVRNCTFNDVRYGVLANYSDLEIKSNSFTGGVIGIRTLYSSPTIVNNVVDNYSSSGIYLYGSGVPKLKSNTVTNNTNYGVFMYNHADVQFGSLADDRGYNEIVNNSSYGIYASYYCDPFLGTTSPYNTSVAGYNSVHDNGSYNLRAYNYSTAEAEWNWWDGESSWSAAINSSYDTSPTLGSAPDPALLGSSLAKSSDGESGYADCLDYDFFNPDTNSECALWHWAHDLRITDQTPIALWAWEMFVRKYPNSEYAPLALIKVANFTPSGEIDELSNYLYSVLNTDNYSNFLRVKALELLVGVNMKNGSYSDAYTCALELLDQSLVTDQERIALFSLIDLSQYILGKTTAALGFLERMKTKYPDDELTLIAAEMMGEEVDWSNVRFEQEPEEIPSAVIPNKYYLYPAFPNPFNPNTTIQYDLPEDASVELSIFDITGRKVISLINKQQNAGQYHVTWQGIDDRGHSLPSGLYIYLLRTSSFTASEKMLLVK
ncbi:MAG: right-handed parallel beta-helix repeat-containing protein [Candidatus Marinimicrobia bacterium]|nr:right-handed parallel beta-helix repeat-containing protein [Candidatus Neomarinimicrobiota bacterium]MCF7840120.1 right-handed parallel beta-helix repeat-containing protein [Candidatus Neomarinimicrobiota bacterium]